MLQTDDVVGLGEIGLDFSDDSLTEGMKQEERKTFQMLLLFLFFTMKHQRPVVIHCRNGQTKEAMGQCWNILEKKPRQ